MLKFIIFFLIHEFIDLSLNEIPDFYLLNSYKI